MSLRSPARMLPWCLSFCAAAVGCRSGGPTSLPTERERVEMLALMLPERIAIQPFTRIKSFDQDDFPDGVVVILRPVDRFGDPVKAVGLFYFELWSYEQASGERKGQRLAFWERSIATADEVRLYWTRAQMYEFQLAWLAGAEDVPPGRKYILTATYRTPWDETIRDEYILDFQMPAEVFRPAGEDKPSE